LNDATPLLTMNASTTGTAFGIEFRGGGLDAFIKDTPASGILNIASGRSVGWGGSITLTTDAVARLTIASTGAATFSSSVTGNRYIINGSNGNAGQIIQQGDLLGTAGTNLLLQSSTGNAIGFLTNGGTTFNMFINSSGNVGIGTTVPSGKLEVNGGVVNGTSFGINKVLKLSNTSVANGSRIGIAFSNNENIGSSLAFLEAVAYNQSIGATSLQFSVYDGTSWWGDMMTLKAGNVGIGTTSPSRKLIVYDTDSNVPTIGLRTNGSGILTDDGFDLQFASSNTFLFNRENGYMAFGTNNNERMQITSGGEIYVAPTTDRGAYNLQVNGTGVWGEGAYVNGSDANVKENIVDLDSSLNIVNNLKPVIFNYINTAVNNDTKHLGFIAQDVYQTLENKDYLGSIVRSDGDTLSIAYSNIIPLLTKAIQEQQALIKALEQRIINLENK